ncbi:hypothetical protein UUU_25940 [Klebsiella pneumoniae subsp. pneumoniae DSM 30104 = JCM 1662 = NBRC 14940]|nr:hypothetical protein UUU_25940 [Klebsiella pneumoniae subsp. pneumoniae DSM 30104 = JCM 1662 = NBRC 14940]
MPVATTSTNNNSIRINPFLRPFIETSLCRKLWLEKTFYF